MKLGSLFELGAFLLDCSRSPSATLLLFCVIPISYNTSFFICFNVDLSVTMSVHFPKASTIKAYLYLAQTKVFNCNMSLYMQSDSYRACLQKSVH